MSTEHLIAHADSLYNAGRFADAVTAYRSLLQPNPNNAQVLNNLGNALKSVRQLAESAACYRRAIALRPDVPELSYNLASVLAEAEDFDGAIAAFELCLRARPGFAAARRNYAGALRSVGRLHESAAQFEQAGASSDLLYLLHFLPETTAASLLKAHRDWGAQLPPPAPHPPRPISERIKVGYVSPDFRNHCQANFLLPLLSNHDHQRFEIFAYDSTAIGDPVGERLLALADQRRCIARLDDAAADAMIRADGIDILVDLTLHMGGNRLPLFARKPAPVQITWLGYPGTTGLAAIDYRLSDPFIDPPGTSDENYVEKTIRLPDTFWCYDPIDQIEASTGPKAQPGRVTFGCLNHFAKVTDQTLLLWVRVMKKVHGSRLILLAPAGSARARVAAQMASQGIPADRITFVDRMPRPDYLRMYRQIDIALDSVPCCGHTTTLDALWMGTPVVTMTGSTAISRGGGSILHQVGLDELITHDAEEFVSCAVTLAEQPDRVKVLSDSLQHRLERSPLMDAPCFARHIEAVYDTCWRKWVADSNVRRVNQVETG